MSGSVAAAIAGAGYIADFHVRAIRASGSAVVAAVCDVDGAKAQRFAAQWGIPESYSSLEEMLSRSSATAVHVLLPPEGHVEAACACLEAKRHVFLEKPLATSSEDIRRMEREAAARGLCVGVNHNQSFHPALLRLEREVAAWKLGALEHVTVVMNVPLRQLAAGQHGHWMFRKPLNILLEQAVHPLSQIFRLLGPARRASAQVSGDQVLNTGVTFTDTWQIALDCERGSAQLFLSFGRDNLDYWLHAIGQDGSACADFRRNTLRVSSKTRFLEPVDHLADGLRGGAALAGQALANVAGYALGFLKLRPPSDPFSLGMEASVGSFYRRLASGRDPLSGLREGLAAVLACEAIERASRLVGGTEAVEVPSGPDGAQP